MKFTCTLSIIFLTLVSTSCLSQIKVNALELEHTETIYDIETERTLGDVTLQKIYQADICTHDYAVNEYLKRFSNAFDPNRELKIHIFAVDSDDMNAFAFLGNHIAVHTGLILKVENENELAAVLAHETAHLKQKHLPRILLKNRQLMPLTIAEALAALALGTVTSSDVGISLATGALAYHQQQLINFTREHEQEADRIGMQLMDHTPYNPTGMPGVFERMKKQTYYQKNPPEYLLTHPLFDSRIADAQDRAAYWKPVQQTTNHDFDWIRARLEAEKSENVKKKVQRLHKKLLEGSAFKDANEYAYALALVQDQQLEPARLILIELHQRYPEAWMLELSLAEVNILARHSEEGYSLLDKLRSQHPQNEAIRFKYAELLLQDHKPKLALQLLFPYRKASSDPYIYQLLTQAYAALKDKPNTHRSKAEWHFCRGEFRQAFMQLDLAAESARNKPDILEQIRSRKEALERLQKKQSTLSL